MASVHCEAEADAYTLGQVAAGLTNGGIITGVHHSNGLVSAYGAVPHLAYAAGHGVSNVANTVGISGLAPAAIPAVPGLYAGAGRYAANSAGVVHLAKRSAEPEAEAYYGYYGLPYSYGYSGYPYAHTAYSYYGKRSAEPEADAEAYYNFGYYGHPYSYGYSGYPYVPSYYGKRSADAKAYTPYQVAAGLPVANAYATGHPHNVGYVAYTSYPTSTYAAYAAYPGYASHYYG